MDEFDFEEFGAERYEDDYRDFENNCAWYDAMDMIDDGIDDGFGYPEDECDWD